jgi:transcriptional regulator with XRE-family HTH domain
MPSKDGEDAVIGGAQIRAARALLNWTATALARQSGVCRMTVQRFERCDGKPPSSGSTLLQVQQALERSGVEFLGAANNQPGVRIRCAMMGAKNHERLHHLSSKKKDKKNR